MSKIETMIEEIKSMTVLELSDLVKAIEECKADFLKQAEGGFSYGLNEGH